MRKKKKIRSKKKKKKKKKRKKKKKLKNFVAKKERKKGKVNLQKPKLIWDFRLNNNKCNNLKYNVIILKTTIFIHIFIFSFFYLFQN